MSHIRSHKFLGIQALRIVPASLVVFTHSMFYTLERLVDRIICILFYQLV